VASFRLLHVSSDRPPRTVLNKDLSPRLTDQLIRRLGPSPTGRRSLQLGLKPMRMAYRNQLVLYTQESLVRDSIGRTVTRRIPLFTLYDHTSEPLPAIRTSKHNPGFLGRNDHPEEVSTSTSTAAPRLLPSLLVQQPSIAVPSTSRKQASPSPTPTTTSGILPTPQRRGGVALAALAPVLPRRTPYRDPHVERLLSKVDRLMACGAGTRAHRGRGAERYRLRQTLPSPRRPLKL
jgi:hypothetical protein